MDKQIEFIKKNQKKQYTITEVEKFRLIPWANNIRTIQKIINIDRQGKNLLQVSITGVSYQKRYTFPASGIIKYLQTNGPALISMVRKTKHHVKKAIGERNNN